MGRPLRLAILRGIFSQRSVTYQIQSTILPHRGTRHAETWLRHGTGPASRRRPCCASPHPTRSRRHGHGPAVPARPRRCRARAVERHDATVAACKGPPPIPPGQPGRPLAADTRVEVPGAAVHPGSPDGCGGHAARPAGGLSHEPRPAGRPLDSPGKRIAPALDQSRRWHQPHRRRWTMTRAAIATATGDARRKIPLRPMLVTFSRRAAGSAGASGTCSRIPSRRGAHDLIKTPLAFFAGSAMVAPGY